MLHTAQHFLRLNNTRHHVSYATLNHLLAAASGRSVHLSTMPCGQHLHTWLVEFAHQPRCLLMSPARVAFGCHLWIKKVTFFFGNTCKIWHFGFIFHFPCFSYIYIFNYLLFKVADSGVYHELALSEKMGRILYQRSSLFLNSVDMLVRHGSHVLIAEDLTHQGYVAEDFSKTGCLLFYFLQKNPSNSKGPLKTRT